MMVQMYGDIRYDAIRWPGGAFFAVRIGRLTRGAGSGAHDLHGSGREHGKPPPGGWIPRVPVLAPKRSHHAAPTAGRVPGNGCRHRNRRERDRAHAREPEQAVRVPHGSRAGGNRGRDGSRHLHGTRAGVGVWRNRFHFGQEVGRQERGRMKCEPICATAAECRECEKITSLRSFCDETAWCLRQSAWSSISHCYIVMEFLNYLESNRNWTRETVA